MGGLDRSQQIDNQKVISSYLLTVDSNPESWLSVFFSFEQKYVKIIIIAAMKIMFIYKVHKRKLRMLLLLKLELQRPILNAMSLILSTKRCLLICLRGGPFSF